MSNIKHQKHWATYLSRSYLLYENSYVPNYAISYFFQNYYLDVWQDSEYALWTALDITVLDIRLNFIYKQLTYESLYLSRLL